MLRSHLCLVLALFLNDEPLSLDDSSGSLLLAAMKFLSCILCPNRMSLVWNMIHSRLRFSIKVIWSEAEPLYNVLPVADLIDTVASDNVVNRAEKAAGVTLSGTAEGADFVFVEWGGVEKIASVQDGIWSAYYPTVLNVTIDLGDFQSFSFSEVTLAEVFAAFPEFSFDDVMSFNVISTEVPKDEIDSTISTVAMSSAGELIGSQVRFVTIDTTPPPTPRVTSLAGNSEINYIESRERILVEGYSEPLNTVQLKWDRNKLTTSSDEDGYWSASLRSALFEDGLHQLMMTTSTDPAGNESGPSVDFYGVDTKRPARPSIDDITSDDVINISEVDSGIYLSGEAEGDSLITLDWNGIPFTTRADVLDRWEMFISSDEFYPSSPSSVDTPGMAWSFSLSPDGNTAFVADSESGVQVIDVSDPFSPSLIAKTVTSGYVSDVKLSPDGTIAFAADGNGLEIIDVSKPVTPVSIARLDTPGSATNVSLSADGSIAFVAAGSSGVQIIDVSNSSNPALISSLATLADASKVTLSPEGDTAFVTCFSTSSGVQIFDISDLANPSLIGTLDHSGYVMDFTLSADGSTAFVVGYQSGLRIIDISDLSSPSVLATYNPPGLTQVVSLSSDGNTALLSEDGKGLHVLDISSISVPSLVGIIDTFEGSADANSSVSGYLVDLALSSDDNTAFVANTEVGLQIFDIHSHTSDPKLSGDLSITSVDLFGNISSERTVTPVFDLSAPAPPVLSSHDTDSIVLNSTARSSGFSLDGSAEPLSKVFSTWLQHLDSRC